MMKKITTVFLVIVFILVNAGIIPAFAATNEDAYSTATVAKIMDKTNVIES